MLCIGRIWEGLSVRPRSTLDWTVVPEKKKKKKIITDATSFVDSTMRHHQWQNIISDKQIMVTAN